MLEAVYQIGKSLPKRDFLEDYIEEIGKGYKHVFKIVFDISEYPDVKYKGIEYEEYDPAKKMKYFYKRGSASGTDYTPTSRITQLQTTFDVKIIKCIKNFGDVHKKYIKNINFFNNLKNAAEGSKEKIYSDLMTFIKGRDLLDSKGGIINKGAITLFFKKNSTAFYLGEMEDFVTVFESQGDAANKDFYNKYDTISIGENKYCTFCKKEKDQVWGFVSTYSFYTVDKPGMATGGFIQENAWKNNPVCPECANILSNGRSYIDNSDNGLKNNFCGFQYHLIPELIYDDKSLLQGVLERIKKYTQFWMDKDGNKGGKIERQEDRILKELAEEKNYVNFNFLFYAVNSSEFKILLNIKDVAPSFISHLMKIKEQVDREKRKYDMFEQIETAKKDIISFDFSFSQIRTFFPNTKREGNFDKAFLEVVNNIFLSKQISFNLLITSFMKKIRDAFVEGNNTFFYSKQAYKILIYLDALEILDKRRFTLSGKTEAYKDFFDENQMLDNDTSRSVFLLGVLTQKLLNWQKREKNGATPFMSRLNGLKIDHKTIMRLLPEIINKLEEYKKNYYKELEQGISSYMLNAKFNEFSIDELSFNFVLGMNLADLFHKEEDKKIPEGEITNE